MHQKTSFTIISFLIFLVCSFPSCRELEMDHRNSNDYLLRFTDNENNWEGYKGLNGDTMIWPGAYDKCFTDTFRDYAIVLDSGSGLVAIDRHESILFKIFPYDNGPDFTSDGLFRIIENGKIGYADSVTGKIAIKPQFDCAYPFKNGVAKVSRDCSTESEGEHSHWLSNNWFYINKKGKIAAEPKN